MSPPDQPRQRPPRKVWKLVLYAIGLAVNLYALSLEVGQILQGGSMGLSTVVLTVLCGMFAAFLYSEIGKPKA